MSKYKLVECKDSVESAIDCGISELEALQEEMDSWASGMEETNLANSEKCSTVRESADTLESSANDARQALDELTQEVQELFDGKPGKPGCEKHELGKNCKICSWSGKYPDRFKPVLTIYDPPKEEQVNRFNWGKQESVDYTRLVFAEVQESNHCCTYYTSETYKENKEQAITDAAGHFERELALYERTRQIPPEKPTIPAVESVFPEDSQSPMERDVTWQESRPYGKYLSRATRLGSATMGMRAGIEGLREWLSSFEKEGQEPPEWLEDISSHVDDLEQAVEECESVEFPGMYG